MTGPAIARMWEARLHDGQLEAGINWARDILVPSATDAGATSAEVFYSTEPEPRIVVITRWESAAAWQEPEADPQLVARAHAWPFYRVSSF